MESSLPLSQQYQVSEVNLDRREAAAEQSPAFSDKHKNLISTLPKNNDWKFSLCMYQGFWYPESYLQGILIAQENLKPRPTDVIISTHPKSGTTWLKALAFSIVERTRCKDSSSLLLTKFSHDIIPFVEMDATQNIIHRNTEIPILATHMPYSFLPRSVLDSSCKIVYMCRDPKDVFVSIYSFQKKLDRHRGEFIPMKNAYELFCKGICGFGPCLDHVLEYWKASLECPERVLFLKYEDMKRETFRYVKKLAEFMGYPFTSEEERAGLVHDIIHNCSFEKMSNLETIKDEKFYPNTPFSISKSAFFRKGQIGDWKNHLTQEMGDQLNNITEQKLRGSGLSIISRQS